ncbi:hypothetical protein EV421DRAFT_1742829 [Armillaria borealis]|uniref:Uncharacterized protein n=1 Tax=Armillaria borealis TaxID=47425 RepID=A0AA39IWK7_9AGAR|nr:hypothetical protein EV421DRAFT_1742829 [Armillaria borealis]
MAMITGADEDHRHDLQAMTGSTSYYRGFACYPEHTEYIDQKITAAAHEFHHLRKTCTSSQRPRFYRQRPSPSLSSTTTAFKVTYVTLDSVRGGPFNNGVGYLREKDQRNAVEKKDLDTRTIYFTSFGLRWLISALHNPPSFLATEMLYQQNGPNGRGISKMSDIQNEFMTYHLFRTQNSEIRQYLRTGGLQLVAPELEVAKESKRTPFPGSKLLSWNDDHRRGRAAADERDQDW